MVGSALAIHEGLDGCRRFPVVAVGSRICAREVALLLLLGFSAACVSAFGKLSLGLPGHNILRVIFPMALGLAMVPRQGAASVMGIGAVLGGGAFAAMGTGGLGPGALTGLFLIGLLLDVSLLGARTGRSIYLRFALAGLGANLVALLVRTGAKILEAQPLAAWWPKALVSYTLCGLLAGLLSAAVWFRARARRDLGPGNEAAQ